MSTAVERPRTAAPIPALERLDEMVSKVELVFGCVAFAGMLVLVLIPVILRALLSVSPQASELLAASVWMAPVARFLLLWSTFIGASLATRDGKHIAIDAVTRSLSNAMQAKVAAVAAVVAAVLCAALAIVGGFVVVANWDQQTVLRGVNLGPVQLVIPLALCTMAFRFLLAALHPKSPSHEPVP